jgi:hypothetical protein
VAHVDRDLIIDSNPNLISSSKLSPLRDYTLSYRGGLSNKQEHTSFDDTLPESDLPPSDCTNADLKERVDKAEALDPEQKKKLFALLKRFRDSNNIQRDPSHFGTLRFPPFDIELIDGAKPKYHRPFRRSPQEDRIINEYIDELIAKEVLVEGVSEWASPLFLVKKQGTDKKRVVADYRYLNTQTKTEKYPLQITDHMLEQLHGKKVFSLLDLASAYWLWRCTDRASKLAAVSAPRGVYLPRVLFMGLKNAVPQFQRHISEILKPYLGTICEVHLDDIFVFSNTAEEHLLHLEQIFNCLEEYGVMAKLSKAFLGLHQVNVLGHVVSARGVSLQDRLVEKVKACPYPKTVKEMRGFLGLTGYYRRFIKDYASMATPLTDMTKKSSHVHDTPDGRATFECLKTIVCSKPVLKFPDFEKPFVLIPDTSLQHIGMVIEQTMIMGACILYALIACDSTLRNRTMVPLSENALVLS